MLRVGTVIPRVFAGDIVTVVNPDDWNAVIPILVTELGMSIDVKLEHDRNVSGLILVTCEVEINVTNAKLEQDWNVFEPILVTELGIVIDVKPEQPKNA